jgi:hypothetical protein
VISGGPQSKNGGIELVIKMREEGGISPRAMRIVGRELSGTLHLEAWMEEDGKPIDGPRFGYSTLRDKRKE